jgi:agmatinase
LVQSNDKPQSGKLVLLGICSDDNSSYLQGSAAAPPLVRAALHSPASNLTAENGTDFSSEARFHDAGDRQIAPGAQAFMEIEQHVAEIVDQGDFPLVLGGDHAITYPVVRAIAARHGVVNVLHFDAHPDLYDELDGNRLSHACPFARIHEEKLVGRHVQIGIRTMNAHQRAQAERFGVEVHEMRDFDPPSFNPDLEGPLYISFDLDALDPAHVPGVSHHEPGGLTVREVLAIIHKLNIPIVGADIVEYNPARDWQGVTAMVAAKLVKEIGSMVLVNSKK